MTTPHTPTPWKDGPVFGTEGRAVFYQDTTKPGKWQRRLDKAGGIFSLEDAAFIVRACNAHEELLAALKRALPWVKDHAHDWDDGPPVGAREQIIAAIAKAEVKR